MIILGINLSHCSSITLIIDNEIKFFQEEERLSRVRRHKGWPELSLKYMYEYFSISDEDIDLCVICDLQTAKNTNFNINAKEIIFIHHHLSHIFSGYAFTEQKNFNCISIDGGGDFNSWMSIARFENKKLVKWYSNCGFSYKDNKLNKPFFPKCFSKPLGTYWSHPCVLNFGMVDKNGIGGYEGKLMGLAARGDANNFYNHKKKYDANFSLYKKNNYYFIKTQGQTKIGNKDFIEINDKEKISLKDVKLLRKKDKIILKEYDLKDQISLDFASDFASYIQKKTEEIIIKCIEKNNFKKDELIILSGGLFSNVLLNGKLNQSHKIFVVPTMGDEGLSLGAAIWGAYLKDIKLEKLENLYLGVELPKNDQIDFEIVGKYLFQNKIIGLLEGRMECGPRALGGRSILANPSWFNATQSINDRLGRVEYMPFAPVILEEYADEILIDWSPSHRSSGHMTLVYKVKEKWHQKLKGVIHKDGTVRPQVINLNTNPVYYKIIKSFFKFSDIPVLINTSFNLHGEPIIINIDSGLKCLKEKKIDVLIAENAIHTL